MMHSPEHIETAKRAFRELGIKSIPKKPAGIDAPGCRPRPGVVFWIARQDIADRGYEPKTQRLWSAERAGNAEPTPEQWQDIGKRCGGLQREMIAWGRQTTNGAATTAQS